MPNNPEKLTILGSTGSIGQQALDVIKQIDSDYKINFLTANTRIDLLETQALEFNPRAVAIANEDAYKSFKSTTKYRGDILFGLEGLKQAAKDSDNKLVISAQVGFSGVIPTLEALSNGINVALANKETLVSAGSVITRTAEENDAIIIAVDSEHNAILQCLAGENHQEIEKIILTASGGPFRTTPVEKFADLTVTEALDHPNWSMGSKITIDSATMMNKGFEIIEAYWLFKLDVADIDVLVHPQSIIHSMVQFVDGSVKAQLGMPDMRIPISYALTYPKRYSYDFPRMDLADIGKLEFFKPDMERFKCLSHAYRAIEMGGNAPAIVNAANEIAVDAFLNEKIKFIDIPKIIGFSLENIEVNKTPELEDIIAIDKITRKYAQELINEGV